MEPKTWECCLVSRNFQSQYHLIIAGSFWIPSPWFHIPISLVPLTKNRRNVEDSGIVLAVSLSQFYQSIALTAQAYKMVITIICLQIDNCFCNT